MGDFSQRRLRLTRDMISPKPSRDQIPLPTSTAAERIATSAFFSSAVKDEKSEPTAFAVDSCGNNILSFMPCVQIFSASSYGVVAKRAAFKAPTDAPDITDTHGASEISQKYFQTPSWYAPFPPPPARTNPIFFFMVKDYHTGVSNLVTADYILCKTRRTV